MGKVRVNSLVLSIVFFVFFAFFGSILSPVRAASQDKPIKLNFGDIVPPIASGVVYGFEPWVKEIERVTNGRVKITMYHNQSLFKARDAIRAVETGVADMAHFPFGVFTGRFNLIDVLTLPLLIPNSSGEMITKIQFKLWEEFPDLRKDFSTMKMLMFTPNDPYFFVTRDKPVRKMSDVEGLKLRVLGKWPSMAMKALKASPVMIPMPGIYEAVSKGVLDGGLLFQSQIQAIRLYEVLNYWTDAPIFHANAGIVMNLDKWNSLPPDIQKVFEDLQYEWSLRFAKDAMDAYITKTPVIAKKAGTKYEKVTLDKGEYEKMRNEIGRPIWEQWVKEMEKKGLPGQKVLDRTLELAKQYQ